VTTSLKEIGIGCDDPDGLGVELLRCAKEAKSQERLVALLKQVEVNFQGRRGETALHNAVDAGWVEGVKVLLAHDADPMKRDISGATPLWLAETLYSGGEFPGSAIRQLLVTARQRAVV
jgi:hypothetical protein